MACTTCISYLAQIVFNEYPEVHPWYKLGTIYDLLFWIEIESSTSFLLRPKWPQLGHHLWKLSKSEPCFLPVGVQIKLTL